MFMEKLAHQDIVAWFEDFLTDAINLDFWTTGETGSGTPFAVPATPVANGGVTGVTGGTSGNAESIRGAPVWTGSQNVFFEARVLCDAWAVTSLFEVALVDAASSYAVSLVSDVDTPALNAGVSDLACLHIDESQTLATMAFVTDGSTSNYNTTAQTLSPVFTPVNSTYYTFRVGTAGNQSFGFVDGKRMAHGTGATAQLGPAAAVLLLPWIMIRTRGSVVKTATIDYVYLQQDRAARTA